MAPQHLDLMNLSTIEFMELVQDDDEYIGAGGPLTEISEIELLAIFEFIECFNKFFLKREPYASHYKRVYNLLVRKLNKCMN